MSQKKTKPTKYGTEAIREYIHIVIIMKIIVINIFMIYVLINNYNKYYNFIDNVLNVHKLNKNLELNQI